MASRLCLVLGGVRSGKSAFAAKLARDLDRPTLYVATGLATDDEMEERIRRHRQARPAHWTTLEEPLELAARLEEVTAAPDPPGVVLIDSLDFWVSNMLLDCAGHDAAGPEVLNSGSRMLKAIERSEASFILVSSEVGLSLVPPELLGRRFQDLLGLVNQQVAAVADSVHLVVAGIPNRIKGDKID